MAIDPPVFDNTKVTVIFVLGGPGAGVDEFAPFFVFTYSLPRQGHPMRTIGSRFQLLPSLWLVVDRQSNIVYFTKIPRTAGDLLRAEQNRPGSEYGDLIRTHIREGIIVPMEVTIKLLENAMGEVLKKRTSGDGWTNGRGRFLIDGFPRKMDQALKFDETVCVFFSSS